MDHVHDKKGNDSNLFHTDPKHAAVEPAPSTHSNSESAQSVVPKFAMPADMALPKIELGKQLQAAQKKAAALKADYDEKKERRDAWDEWLQKLEAQRAEDKQRKLAEQKSDNYLLQRDPDVLSALQGASKAAEEHRVLPIKLALPPPHPNEVEAARLKWKIAEELCQEILKKIQAAEKQANQEQIADDNAHAASAYSTTSANSIDPRSQIYKNLPPILVDPRFVPKSSALGLDNTQLQAALLYKGQFEKENPSDEEPSFIDQAGAFFTDPIKDPLKVGGMWTVKGYRVSVYPKVVVSRPGPYDGALSSAAMMQELPDRPERRPRKK